MSSLSDDLLKLADLFAKGSLSEEEFRAAKEVTIRRHTLLSSGSASTFEPREAEVQFCTGQASSSKRIDISGFSDDVKGQAQRERAYAILETILQNLEQYPAEQKYRRLRLNNPALQSQLFAVPGVVEFLRSLGFVSDAGVEGWDRWLQLLEAPPQALLREALESIHLLRSRDQVPRSCNRDHMRLRQSLSLEVRRERCERARAVGELRSYIAREFSADDAGDGLSTSRANLETLRVILTNVLCHPTESKYHRLRLSNRTVCRCVLQQRGGLELLVEFAGAEVVEEAEGEMFLVFRSGDGMATEEKLRSALWVVDELQSTLQSACENLDRRTREDAERAMRMEMRTARQQEERRLRLYQREEEQRQGSTPTTEHPPPNRVPIAEAVRFLMGRGVSGER